ncbi:MAG: CoA ester lyase, partial [Gammaproteobacteria bacterium]|nr:CoA ester lyase [Gammaproteobacteria bacterium]
MTVRSWLFVPGDSERKLAKAGDCGADALILDLEDAVAPERRDAARALVREYLQARAAQRAPQLWVRVSPIDSGDCAADLAAVLAARPDGIVQPKPRSAADVSALAAQLDELERRHGIAPGAIRILPIATETPAAMFAIGGYWQCGVRLAGLTWGAEDLSVAIGASGNQEADGAWTAPFQLARSLCLFGAAAAGVAAIDTLFIDYRDTAGLAASCAVGRRDGFSGKLAIHPAQVGVINEGFRPSEAELSRARRVVALFAAHPGAAALSLDGRMVDIPHLR